VQENVFSIESISKDDGKWIWGGGDSFLKVSEGKIEMFFGFQCMYKYKFELDSKEIAYYWDYDMDCVYDRKLKQTFKSIPNPEIGEKFATIRYNSSDTSLTVKYLYPEWVKQINNSAKDIDTLFPTHLKYQSKW